MKRLGQLLLHDNVITIEDLNEALEYQKNKKVKIGVALLDCGCISDDILSEYLETQKKLERN